jgi:hypothetical protein
VAGSTMAKDHRIYESGWVCMGPPLLPALAVGAFAPLSITGDEMAVVEVSTRRMGSRGWPNSRISTSACTVVCAYDFRLAMLLMTALLKTG